MKIEADPLGKVLRLIGLARRANNVQFGAEACEKAARKGRTKLLFIAADAGQSTRQRFTNLADEFNLAICDRLTAEVLAKALGRGNVAVVSVNNEHFAAEMQRLLITETET